MFVMFMFVIQKVRANSEEPAAGLLLLSYRSNG